MAASSWLVSVIVTASCRSSSVKSCCALKCHGHASVAGTSSTSVAFDAWTARNPAQIESRIAADPAIFPAGKLAAISPMVDAAVSSIDAPGGMVGPKLGQLEFWRDVVPEDRLRSRN